MGRVVGRAQGASLRCGDVHLLARLHRQRQHTENGKRSLFSIQFSIMCPAAAQGARQELATLFGMSLFAAHTVTQV